MWMGSNYHGEASGFDLKSSLSFYGESRLRGSCVGVCVYMLYGERFLESSNF